MAPPSRLLLRPAAGPRLGFGHLVRARSLARVLEGEVWVSPRGGSAARAVARSLGLRVPDAPLAAALDALRPSLLVIDDPSAAHAARALHSARRRRVRVASVHDLGLAPIASDLVVDGSLRPGRGRGSRALLGPRFAVLDPALQAHRRRRVRPQRDVTSVLIALGGGPRRGLAAVLARAVAARLPNAQVHVAGGFAAAVTAPGAAIRWLGPQPSLAPHLLACDLAIVAGGMTLYEACALGRPVVGVAVVPAQLPTLRAAAGCEAAVDGGLVTARTAEHAAERVGRLAARLARDRRRRLSLGSQAARLVDGRGAWRVARALGRLAAGNGA